LVGTITNKDTRMKKAKDINNAYILVIICLKSRGVHLVVLESLLLSAVISGLRVFAAHRDMPSKIYSDQGTSLF
jgi:hypothetical protein